MPRSDIYPYSVNGVSVAAIVATPIMSVFGTAAKRLWVVGARVRVGVTTAPAGNLLKFQIARPANTPTGTGLASVNPEDFSAPVSIGQLATAWSTAPTLGIVLATLIVPQVTASGWVEFPPSDYELGVPAIANGNVNAGLHMFVTPSNNTATPVDADMIVSE